MEKILVWDMDGTIADLYNVPNWLNMLEAKNATPYTICNPLWDMEELAEILVLLQKEGWKIEIVTWHSRTHNTDKQYQQDIRERKKDWLTKYSFPYDNFHCVQYGTKKSSVITHKNAEIAILFDDNAEVRETWRIGETVDPEEIDVIEYLKNLLIGKEI